jgi:DNA mismatch repair protein MutH
MGYLCSPFFHEKILLRYAQSLTGYTLGELSAALLNSIPKNLNIYKGFVGQLIEKFLGIVSNNHAQQDFDTIGVELKTIPINKYGYPIESTFICSVPLIQNTGLTWENSYFYKKITRILWIPIESERNTAISNRIIRNPFLWSPSNIEEKIIKKDWKDFMNLIILGKIERITGEYGNFLQILKKSNKKYTRAVGLKSQFIRTHPRAFYFKKKFTYLILKNEFSEDKICK